MSIEKQILVFPNVTKTKKTTKKTKKQQTNKYSYISKWEKKFFLKRQKRNDLPMTCQISLNSYCQLPFYGILE
jgi:hypothetical protein